MEDQNKNKKFLKFHIVGILVGLASLALPWWTLFCLVKSNVIASFNLFLWQTMKHGFIQAPLSFELWSYITFALVGAGCFLGIRSYMFRRRGNKNWRNLLALQSIFLIAGCLVYLCSLLLTFAVYRNLGTQNWWVIARFEGGSPIKIALLNVFYIGRVASLDLVILEFLSIGFWLAVIAAAFSLVILHKIRDKE